MIERRIELAGLSAISVGEADAALVVIILHGRAMEAADLAPFAHSLGIDAQIVFPDAPELTTPRGRTWWPIDSEARIRALAHGPIDLAEMDPPGRHEARAQLAAFSSALGRRQMLVGFSQGGMLAMDYVLHAAVPPAGLVLLSSSRIAFGDWTARLPHLAGLPVLVAHGHADAELSFAAGERLRDAAIAGGARVTWLPFEGTHQIPLVVWRALRKFLRAG